MDTVGSRVIPLTDDGDLWKRHFASADMVIEAVPENMDLKHRCVRCFFFGGGITGLSLSSAAYGTTDFLPASGTSWAGQHQLF